MTTSLLILLLARSIPTALEVARLVRTARAEGRPIDRRAIGVYLLKLAGRAIVELPPDE
ncbi:hypothetical protein WMF20_29210 [Sorangium sp. So ce834]|uniref:hypothetical protein n=1 Tax=Sorangium sp. So ce834 TaxID=3133321 RepID=UPI003F63A5D4